MFENEILDFDTAGSGLTITPQARGFLIEVAKWAKFLSIVGFIFLGLMVLFALFFGTIMFGTMGREFSGSAGLGGGFITLIYLIGAGLYVMPLIYLYRFATKMKTAIDTNNTPVMTDALENLKSHYKYIGIFMIVLLALYAVGIVISLIFGAMAMNNF